MAFLLPDALVLAAGGTVGEAWMTGVLAGIETGSGVDFRRVEQLVGTSAGSIVAASLASGRSPRRPRDGAEPPAPTEEPARRGLRLGRTLAAGALAAAAPLAPTALALGAPGGALARSLLLSRVPGGGRSLARLREFVDARGARFDGRLRVVAVDRADGRRIVFGAPGAPGATVGEAVAASCSVPWIFEPVRIAEREYVDGGVWSLTNLDVAQAGRGTEVLCLNVTASLPLALSSPLGALRAAARTAETVETQALRRRGARVRTIGPDAASAAAIGANLMDDRLAGDALAAGYRQGLRLASDA
jgi:NTE family protein